MRKIILTFVFLIISQFNFANTNDTLLIQARKHSSAKEYALAIKDYKNYLKSSDTKEIGNVCLEIANCYFKNNDKNNAIKYLRKSITKYGLTEEIFIYSVVLDAEFSKYALSVVYDDLSKMQQKYTASLD
jgi:lipopolysaccharide biosynthesis regulator YciM